MTLLRGGASRLGLYNKLPLSGDAEGGPLVGAQRL